MTRGHATVQASGAAVEVKATPAPPSEEASLWAAWRGSRDEPARQRLIAQHLPYARVIAAMVYGQRPNNDIDFDDYLQLARVGLLEALDRYDPEGGAQFRTYASSRIRGAVLEGLTHLTERQQQMALRRRLLTERTASLTAASTDPEPPGPAPESGRATVPQGGDLFRYLASVGMGLAMGFILEDTSMWAVSDETASSLDNSYRAQELKDTRIQLLALVRQLPSAERRVIQLHYQQGHAFEEIARELELTKGRISQLHKKALSSLRDLLAARRACDRAF
jgi:RNA polymerase sigma factor for flagellar operon FliA